MALGTGLGNFLSRCSGALSGAFSADLSLSYYTLFLGQVRVQGTEMPVVDITAVAPVAVLGDGPHALGRAYSLAQG